MFSSQSKMQLPGKQLSLFFSPATGLVQLEQEPDSEDILGLDKQLEQVDKLETVLVQNKDFSEYSTDPKTSVDI